MSVQIAQTNCDTFETEAALERRVHETLRDIMPAGMVWNTELTTPMQRAKVALCEARKLVYENRDSTLVRSGLLQIFKQSIPESPRIDVSTGPDGRCFVTIRLPGDRWLRLQIA